MCWNAMWNIENTENKQVSYLTISQVLSVCWLCAKQISFCLRFPLVVILKFWHEYLKVQI